MPTPPSSSSSSSSTPRINTNTNKNDRLPLSLNTDLSNLHSPSTNINDDSAPSPRSGWRSMFPWGRRGSASQASGGMQAPESAYIPGNNYYDDDDILGTLREMHHHQNRHHQRQSSSQSHSNIVPSFHPTSASRYNVNYNNGNDIDSHQHQQKQRRSRSNRSSQRYSHMQNNNHNNYGHGHGHQQQDSVQSMQQFYHLHEYRLSEEHNSIRYYTAGDYHLDLTTAMGSEQDHQNEGGGSYMHSRRRTMSSSARMPERKVVVNWTSMDQVDESELPEPFTPPHPHFMTSSTTSGASTGTPSTTRTITTATIESGSSPSQCQVDNTNDSSHNNNNNNNISGSTGISSNGHNNSPTTIINKTLAKLTTQAGVSATARHHSYSGSLASSSSISSSSSSSTVVSASSPTSFPQTHISSQITASPQTPIRSRMSYPTTPFSSSPPSTPKSNNLSDRSPSWSASAEITIDTRGSLTKASSPSPMSRNTPSMASTSPVAIAGLHSSPSSISSSPSSTSSPSTLNNNSSSSNRSDNKRSHHRHSLQTLQGGGSLSISSLSPSSPSSSLWKMTMKMEAFEESEEFKSITSSPEYSISTSPPRSQTSLHQLQQQQQQQQQSHGLVARPLSVYLSGSGSGGVRKSSLRRMAGDDVYSKEGADPQENLVVKPVSTLAAVSSDTGQIANRGAGGGGGGGTDGDKRDEDGALELGVMLSADRDDESIDDDGCPLEACCVFSVPDWETVKAGLLPTSKPARDALMATIVLALITITLEAVLLYRHKAMTISWTGSTVATSGMSYEISFFRPLTVYYYIFILAEVFAVGLLWDAAIHKNSMQLVAFTLFEWCMVTYSGLQIWQHDQLVKGIGMPAEVLVELGCKTTQMILFSQLGVQLAACLGITLLTWRLYSEFGWLVFQKLGADVSLRKMMKEYRLLFTLLKLDAFFFFGYAIQVAALTDKQWQKGLAEIAFAIPLSGIIILLGFCALRNENKVTMGGFISCLGLLIAYMIYRLVALYQTLTGNPSTDPYFFARKTMTVFAALTLFVTVLALVYAVVMLYNFNKGLKEAMQQYRVRRSGTIRSVTPSTRRTSVNGGLQYTHGLVGLGGTGYAGEIGIGSAGKRTSSHHSGGINGLIGLGSGFGMSCGGGSNGSGGGIGGGGGGARGAKRVSRRSLLHCESAVIVPTMVERWPIE